MIDREQALRRSSTIRYRRTTGYRDLDVTVEFAEIDGILRCTRAEVSPAPEADPPRPLTTRDLASIPLGRLNAAALARYEPGLEAIANSASADVAARAREQQPLARRVSREAPRTGRPSRTDYAAVAAVYNAAARAGRRDVAKAVAEHFGIKRGTARKRISTARRLGDLPPTTPRRARAADSQM